MSDADATPAGWAPPEARAAGTAPFHAPGTAVMWRYRRATWKPGAGEFSMPLRVVRDDEAGLVAWLSSGTVGLIGRLADGADLRDAPRDQAFTARRIQARGPWRGPGVLRIAPTGRSWSVWLFRDDQGSFTGWYVNLEAPHRRLGTDLYSADHVLDVTIAPDGTSALKDQDELDLATEQGRFTAAEAKQIRSNAHAAIASFASGDWPFEPEWTAFRADPSWTVPPLPPEERWEIDLTGAYPDDRRS